MRRVVAALVTAGLLGALAWSAGPAQGGPIVTDRPRPSIVPSVLCVVRDGSFDKVWFGLENLAVKRQYVPVGPGNRTALASVGPLLFQRQPTWFAAQRRVARAFMVTVSRGGTPTWSITAPMVTRAGSFYVNDAGATVPATLVAERRPDTPDCPAGTPTRAAVPQGSAPDGEGGMSVTPVAEVVSAGRLVQASVEFSVTGINSVCSEGGMPMPPLVLFGYRAPTVRQGGVFMKAAGADYAPLPSSKVVRTDTFTAPDGALIEWQRTWAKRRTVVDPQRIWVFGSTIKEQLRNPSPRGFSGTNVIADVWARCRFGDRVVRSTFPIYSDGFGPGFDVHTVTDIPTQRTRNVIVCPPNPPLPVVGCDVPFLAIGPGGGKLFR